METFSTETFSVEEDFPMDEILSDRMESARPKDAGGSMKAPGTEPFLLSLIHIYRYHTGRTERRPGGRIAGAYEK